MSVEDLDSDFLSDDSDHEAEKELTDGDNDEANYQELVHLHNSLLCFDHIYINNTIIDTQYEDEDQSGLDLDSVGSELNLIQDYIDIVFEDVLSTISSPSPSATSPEDGSGSDTENSSSSLGSSPASDSTDGHMTNSDRTDNVQDEAAEWQL